MSPYTPLHDVNVTSIYNNTRTHILIFLYKTNLCFDLWAEEGRNRCSFLPPYDTFRSKIHIYSCSQHSLLEKSLVRHIYWSFNFDYLKVNTVMFINYFFIYVYCNHKNYLIGGGDWKLLLSDLRIVWSDKSSFQSSPKSNWWTKDDIITELLTFLLQIIKSYPQNKWQTSDFLVQS